MAHWPNRKAQILLAIAATVILAIVLFVRNRPVTLRGAVIRAGDDPGKQVPIADAKIEASDGAVRVDTRSDTSGAFQLSVRRALIRRHSLVLTFRHPDYKPLEIVDPSGNKLYVARMVQVSAQPAHWDRPLVHVSRVSIRYTTRTPSTVDVGSGVKTFEVTNKANVPCRGDVPCSPDGKWKAGVATATLDAGPDNEFRNARVSCIAGPCPFTAISHDGFSKGGPTISVTVVDWSDTATFLIQAEAVRKITSEAVRKSYPVIFDGTMSFSVPASAQGTCVQAEVDGAQIVFPIDPDLSLSWANCEVQKDAEGSKLFRCELNPGYEFR